jgi:hypothetical protein
VTALDDAAGLARSELGLVVMSTLRADGTIQSSIVNSGVIASPATGESSLAFVPTARSS